MASSGLARVLAHGDDVAQRLGRVPHVREPVVDRHAGIPRQRLDDLVARAAELDAVVEAAEDPRGVLGRLLVAELAAVRVEVGQLGAEVVGRDLEGTPGARGGLLEDEGDDPAEQGALLTALPAGRLEPSGQLHEGDPLRRGEVDLLDEVTSGQVHTHAGMVCRASPAQRDGLGRRRHAHLSSRAARTGGNGSTGRSSSVSSWCWPSAATTCRCRRAACSSTSRRCTARRVSG